MTGNERPARKPISHRARFSGYDCVFSVRGQVIVVEAEGVTRVFKPGSQEHLDLLEAGADIMAADDHPVLWLEIRRERNRLLSESDWTQVPDRPEASRLAWQAYRQALRDLPETFSAALDVVYPELPE